MCVDRGVNKRYTNVSHLGVYPSSFRRPVLFFVPLPSRPSAISLPRQVPPLLRRRARARSGSSVYRARRSRGDGEREATASRVSAVVTLVAALQHHPRRVEGRRERRRRRRGEVSPRPRRGKKRAPHPPWHVRGGSERSMEGGRFILHLSVSLSFSFSLSLPRSLSLSHSLYFSPLHPSARTHVGCTLLCVRVCTLQKYRAVGRYARVRASSISERKISASLFSLPAREGPPTSVDR